MNFQNCCDASTEVLTPRGWVLFPDLLDDDEVYQVNPNTLYGSFVYPERIVSRKYEGELVEIAAKWGSFRYTPDHRVLSYHPIDCYPILENASRWGRYGQESIIGRKVCRSSIVCGGRKLTDGERFSLELAVLVQAEGSKDQRMHSNARYDIRVRSQRKIDQLSKLLPVTKEPNGRHKATVYYNQVSNWLDDSQEKNFKPTILNLSYDDLNFFYDTLHKWDGDYTRQSAYGQKESKRKPSLDLVQAIACMIGRSTQYYKHPTKDFAVINFHKNSLRYQSKTIIKSTYYSGMVYCVTVPTSAFLIRRNNQVVVTGNCPASGELGEAIQGQVIAPEGWLCVSIDYNQLEPWCTALLTGDTNLTHDLLTGVCLHCKALSWIPRLSEGKTYEEIYQLAVVDKHPDWQLKRKKAKGFNFKQWYGGGAKSIAEIEDIAVEDVQAAFDGRDVEYPGIKDFNEQLYKSLVDKQQISKEIHFGNADKKGRVFKYGLELLPIFDGFGEKPRFDENEFRHFSQYRSRFGGIWSFQEFGRLDRYGRLQRYYSTTQTKNYWCQGTAGQVVDMAIAECFEYVLQYPREVRLIRQIHDEIGFYVKEDKKDLHIPKLCDIMSNIKHLFKKYLSIEVPINFIVEAKTGKNFYDLEVYNGRSKYL